MKKLPLLGKLSDVMLVEEKPDLLQGWVLKKIYVSSLPGSTFKDSLCGACKRELNDSWICMFSFYYDSVVKETLAKVYCEDCASMKCQHLKVAAILYSPHWGYIEMPDPTRKQNNYLPKENRQKKIKTIVEL